MKYVYILHSVAFPDRYYTGITEDLRTRLVSTMPVKSPTLEIQTLPA